LSPGQAILWKALTVPVNLEVLHITRPLEDQLYGLWIHIVRDNLNRKSEHPCSLEQIFVSVKYDMELWCEMFLVFFKCDDIQKLIYALWNVKREIFRLVSLGGPVEHGAVAILSLLEFTFIVPFL
jgi:hypothetical protein